MDAKGERSDIEQGENEEELQYLNLVRKVIEKGEKTSDRTGTGTVRLFGETCRYDLTNGKLPVLTTKKMFFRGVVEELLWFMTGSTDSKKLEEKGVNIWNGNGSRAALDKLGFKERREGDLGPVYGFSWRHFGADYKTCDDDYENKGFDQLVDLVEQIKTNPSSRRLILCNWNPLEVKNVALPPCHVVCQFSVSENKELSCLMYQRSCDMGLGCPFNIVSYSLLTHIVARICGLKAKEFVHMIGDCHVYSNHIEQLKVQIERKPFPFPTLEINEELKTLEDFVKVFQVTRTEKDLSTYFRLKDYKSHAPIKMEMSV